MRNVSIQSIYSGTILPSCGLWFFFQREASPKKKFIEIEKTKASQKPQKCSYNAYKFTNAIYVLRCKCGGTNGFNIFKIIQ